MALQLALLHLRVHLHRCRRRLVLQAPTNGFGAAARITVSATLEVVVLGLLGQPQGDQVLDWDAPNPAQANTGPVDENTGTVLCNS